MNVAAKQNWFQQVAESIRREPFNAVLFTTLVVTLVYFFGFLNLFRDGHESTLLWTVRGWNSENNLEHGWLILPFAAFLVWYERDKLKNAPIGSSRWGWLFVGIGLLLFIAGARTLQPRFSLTALPVALFGVVLYVWGKSVARVLFFPIAFLLFAVPLGFLTQATFRLQFVETGIASAICNLIGVHVDTVGTVVNSRDNAFHFQVDEGCSGIHSLMAIAMLSAIYGHFMFDKLWKKLAIFVASLFFAVIGNAGRLVTIFVVGKFFGQDLAGGPYHSISGYLSFPFALIAMVLFGMLLNIKLHATKPVAATEEARTYDS